ncbi:MAG: hypothetical protein M1822_001969 [Bathelium mastoideum]|nr:MAG: hypothetical protein M1822_001969 [Bathelium mastoideum]
MALVGQWFWYEKLQHGNRWRLVSWKRGKNSHDDGSEGAMPGTAIEAVEPLSGIISTESETPRNGKDNDQPQPAEHLLLISSEKAWRMPCYGSFASNKAEDFGDLASSPSSSPKSRPIFRAQPSNALPFIPPSNIVLFTSLLLTLVQVHATPTPPSRIHNPSSKLHLSASSSSASRIETAGTLLAWLSTALYLGSRLPQLLKNQRRRSTAGLAPALFAAAFFGNLFYSASLLANPCAWRDMPAWGGHGWVGRDGNTRGEWVERALPFFLGAAGVLAMDAGVGVQFLVFGEGRGKGEEMERDVVGDAVRGEMAASLAFREHEEERVVQRTVPIRIQRPDGGGSGNAVGAAVGDVLALPNSWQRVTGWMRGWMPSPQRVMVKRDESSGNNRNEAERQGLLRREEWLGDE